jgi:hypothetical protein
MYSICFKKDLAKRFHPSKFVIRYSAVRCLIQAIAMASLITKKTCRFGLVSYDPTSWVQALTLWFFQPGTVNPEPLNLRLFKQIGSYLRNSAPVLCNGIHQPDTMFEISQVLVVV